VQALALSPGIAAGGFIFVTGMTGSGADGSMPPEPENQFRRAYVRDPFPAWTAVEVAGLRREGALVEIRVIAALGADA